MIHSHAAAASNSEPVHRRAPRPIDAATLIITRVRAGRVEVLMGERHRRHSVHPQRYVFPGGKVDREDSRVRAASPIRDDVMALLTRRATPGRARALIAAAVRETFEEAGLMIGGPDPAPAGHVPANWKAFFSTGMAPAFDRISYIARAVTPANRPVRFNVRFFMIDADHVAGQLGGSGELLKLQYVPVADTGDLDIPNITKRILKHVEDIAREPRSAPRSTVPCFRFAGADHERIEE